MKHIKLFEVFLPSDNKSTIILFGPQGVGKSTLAKQLGSELNMGVIGSDDFIDQGNWSAEEIWSKGWQVRKQNEYKGMPYWIARNSWDTIWGNNGYFKIAMYQKISEDIEINPTTSFERINLVNIGGETYQMGGVLIFKPKFFEKYQKRFWQVLPHAGARERGDERLLEGVRPREHPRRHQAQRGVREAESHGVWSYGGVDGGAAAGAGGSV